MIRGPAAGSAPADAVWNLIARPDQWHRWSPHVRGAEGLGTPEVRAGASGHVVLVGGAKLPAEILSVEPGRSWTWRVGGLVLEHIVTTAPDEVKLEMPVRATRPLWKPVAAAYQPVVNLIARRIVRLAERDGLAEYPSLR